MKKNVFLGSSWVTIVVDGKLALFIQHTELGKKINRDQRRRVAGVPNEELGQQKFGVLAHGYGHTPM